MKRIFIVLLAFVLALCCCACAEGSSVFAKEYKLPEDTVILGLDMTGLTKEAAFEKLSAAAESYVLQLTVDGETFEISGKDIELTAARKNFMAAMDAIEAGTEPDLSKLITYKDAKLRPYLGNHLNWAAEDAAIVYDEATGAYTLKNEVYGFQTDRGALADEIRVSLRTLNPQHTATGFSVKLEPQRTADHPNAQRALDFVNKMSAVQLSYNFGTEKEPIIHEIPAEAIRYFIQFGEDGFHPSVNEAAVEEYVAELAAQYDTAATTGPFPTTGGEVLDMVITYNACHVDTAALAENISTCMLFGLSGERQAPYLPGGVKGMPFNGTYVEVDLTNQHMWFYKDGILLTDSDLVSGNVAAGHHTPTGVFQIYSRSYGTTLEGPGYASWVNFWMPFIGGYGLHDAGWRSEFGGDIYLTDGSHGCVNLPYEPARILINNSRSGETRVVIYGGEGSQPAKEQSFKGKTEYTVAVDAEPFKLDARSHYAWPDYYYESDNPDVVTVDENGMVTIQGLGTANVTVTCTTEGYFASASTTIPITVLTLCEDGRHEMGEPEVTTAPTCVSGVETTRCTKCDYFEEKELRAINDHTPGQWTVTEEPTCQEHGRQVIQCTVCAKELDSERIEKLDHTPGQWIVTQEPTCEERGEKVIHCTACDKELDSERIDATGHSFDGAACKICGEENPDYEEAE